MPVVGFSAAMVPLDRYTRAAMTRDIELIRKIVVEIQSRKDAKYGGLEIPSYDGGTVAHHLELMMDAGLIEAQKIDGNEMPYAFVVVKDLTWAGHDFASALANENVWGKIKKTFSPSELAAMPLSVLKELGVALVAQWAKDQLGLSQPFPPAHESLRLLFNGVGCYRMISGAVPDKRRFRPWSRPAGNTSAQRRPADYTRYEHRIGFRSVLSPPGKRKDAPSHSKPAGCLGRSGRRFADPSGFDRSYR
jgi:Hypothetical protein (DUF2513)